MFCDLVDSTSLAQQLDPEELREVLGAYQALCAEVVKSFGGTVAQYLGDGVVVYFGYPQAHEDDGVRAVTAALELLEGFPGINQRLRSRIPTLGSREIQLRVGIHTGHVVVGDVGSGDKHEWLALGDAPYVAARLQAVAGPGQVVVGEATRRLLRGQFELEALGATSLKGLSEPIRVFRVAERKEAGSQVEAELGKDLTPFVGRDGEVASLLDFWNRTKRGRGQAVLLRGEAGIGKSRLVRTFRDRIAGEPHEWLLCRGSPRHERTAFHPLMVLLEQSLSMDRREPVAENLARLVSRVRAAHLPADDVVPLFASLLSLPLPEEHRGEPLSADARRAKTLEALRAWVLGASALRPAVVVVEDIHWLDPSTLEFVDGLIDGIEREPLLLLLVARPEFDSPWEQKPRPAVIELPPLQRGEVESIARSIAESHALTKELMAHVVAKTDGIPLFAEELTKALLEGRATEPLGETHGPTIPSTLHDSLMARLDRLGPAKEVAQLAAVLGREFPRELIQAVWPRAEVELDRELLHLQQAGLLYARGERQGAAYVFKHALVQDAAYASLLRRQRRKYHDRIAEVLEKRFPDRAAAEPEILAWHYDEAGRAAEAIAYYETAGERATSRSAYAEAIEHLRRGIELLRTLPEGKQRNHRELALQVALGAPLMAARSYTDPATEQAYARAVELCRGIGDAPQLSQALLGLATFYLVRGQLDTASEVGQALRDLGKRVGEPAPIMGGEMMVGLQLLFRGEPRQALARAESVIAMYDPALHRELAVTHGQDGGVVSRLVAGWSHWLLGYPDQALRSVRDAVDLAREVRHPFSLVFALAFCGAVHQMRREPDAARGLARELIALSTEQHFPVWLGWGLVLEGWGLAESSAGDQAIDTLREGLTRIANTGANASGPLVLSMLADATHRQGRRDEALRWVKTGFALAKTSGQHFWDAELHRLRGVLMLEGEPPAHPEAESCFREALETARRQSARSLELRAATSAAHLWAEQGREDEARAILSELCDQFTEGFDTADLMEATQLLDATNANLRTRR